MSLFFHWISAFFQSIVTMGCHQLFNLVLSFLAFCFEVFGSNLKEVLCSKVHFRGLDLTSYPLGMILWQLFSGKFMHFYFSIIRFSRKLPSRMNNLYRKNPIFVQNRFNRFHHFSIGPTQLSNLLQPFAVGSNQCLAYFMVLSLDFSSCSIYWIFCNILPWLSSVVKSISSF